jgi:hypothetical protein
LRTLLIHGARSVFHRCDRRDDALGVWVRQLKQRRGSHKTIVALANKRNRPPRPIYSPAPRCDFMVAC